MFRVRRRRGREKGLALRAGEAQVLRNVSDQPTENWCCVSFVPCGSSAEARLHWPATVFRPSQECRLPKSMKEPICDEVPFHHESKDRFSVGTADMAVAAARNSVVLCNNMVWFDV